MELLVGSIGLVFLTILIVLLCIAVAFYLIAPGLLLDSFLALGRWHAGLKRRESTLDMVNWVWLDSGGEGDVIVLIHGFAAHKYGWLQVASRLRGRGYRLIIPDLPGFGENQVSADISYSVLEQAQRLQTFLASLGINRFHAVGHSMGGYVAGACAFIDSDMLLSLYLVAPAGITVEGEPIDLSEKGKKNNLFIIETVEQFQEVMAIAMANPPKLPRRIVESMVARELTMRKLREKQNEVWDSPSLQRLLSNCSIPLRMLWGERDRMLSVDRAALIVEAVPMASIRYLPDIAHVIPQEAPSVMVRDYLISLLLSH
uniref:PedQ n=1 Tax=symbiont bacterium of Paederus fuscipes TaxID=176282 RepID=Q5I686_UNCXX|nr:PedQ [symbiont bacterium of Paederus fuscipes]